MKRFFITGILALSVVIGGLWAQAKQPQPKSQKELDAINAMIGAQDPDSRIKAADELVTKFADTDFKSLAFYVKAFSYEQKGDQDKMIIFAEQTVEADPKHYMAMLMIARGLALRTREHDLDKEERLGKAEKYAKQAMELVKTAEKPNPQVTDEQWVGAKKDFESQGHESLGIIAQARKKYDVAVSEYKLAYEGGSQPEPALLVRMGQAYNLGGKYDEAIVELNKVLGDEKASAQIKQFAQAERVRASQAKNAGAPKPAAPPAPPQVEVKKQ